MDNGEVMITDSPLHTNLDLMELGQASCLNLLERIKILELASPSALSDKD